MSDTPRHAGVNLLLALLALGAGGAAVVIAVLLAVDTLG
jgi:hypothetical protein